jgi:hypothetical protein
VRGTPFVVNGRTFVPEARLTALTAREALIGAGGTRVLGVRLERVRPTALIEQIPGGERRHPIPDATARRLAALLLAALATPWMVHALVARIAGRERHQ